MQHPTRVAAAGGASPAHSDSRGVPSAAATQPPRKLQTASAASASAAALTPNACRHARATLASFLAAAVTLTSPWGPLDAAAAVAATAATPEAPTAAIAPANAAAAEGLAAAAAAPAATTAPGVRFTGPEVLQQVPPLPDTFPPLPELKLPKYTTATLRNGLRVFLLRDDEVPLVRATLLMRGGQYGSPPDKVGTATLTSYVQRAGGSTAHPAPGLDTRLEELAAAIELGAGQQALSADMSCLAEDVEEVMGLMAEVVRSPALPADKLSLYQAQLYNALEHQNDSPVAVARRKMTKLLYGPDSIYARTPTKAMVSSITVADLAAYVATWERPDAAVLGVVGAFEPRSMMALIEKEFGDWAPAPGQPEQPPPVPRGPAPALPPQVEAAAASRSAAAAAGTPSSPSAAAAGTPAAVATAAGASSSAPPATAQVASAGGAPEAAGAAADSSAGAAAAQAAPAPSPAPGGRPKRPIVYLVDRPGLTQANVLLGEPGIALSDPDVFALDALGGVFNSFGGQLFDTLRSREGLAYSVSGGWDSPPDHPGLFLAGGQTSAPGEFLRSLRQLLGRAAAEPPSLKELEAAKAETLNSFAFNFASSSNQLQRILVYDLLGLPQDYLFRYFRGIEDVSRSDVLAAAAAHLHPDSQAVVVVADRELAAPSLEAAGFEVVPMRLEDA